MLKNIKDWWNQDTITELNNTINECKNSNELAQTTIEELSRLNSQLIENIKSQDKVIDSLQDSIAVYENQEAEREAKHNDKTPWIEITSDGFDEVKGVKVSIDWNDAFIAYLEDLSIKGPTEQAAVQRWLALVNLHLIDQLEAEAIENDPRGTVKDVVDGY